MEFVVLYGRPAVGKLTVGRELAKISGYRLFDNHLVVDAALAVYDFGSPGFIALREALWRVAFERIAQDQALTGLIFTFTPEATVPQQFVDDLFALFLKAGIATRCVELTAPETTIMERLARADRASKGKLVEVEAYRQLRDSGAFNSPVITHNRLVLDTSTLSATEAAQKIVAELLHP
jgi:hypothetical protein